MWHSVAGLNNNPPRSLSQHSSQVSHYKSIKPIINYRMFLSKLLLVVVEEEVVVVEVEVEEVHVVVARC